MSLTTYRKVCTDLLEGLDGLQDPRYPFPGYITAAMDRARELLAQPALAEPPVFALQWSENKPPGEECRYDHCTAQTPFGNFLITWKSWKKYDYPTVDETPWGDSWQAFATVEIAKAVCQREFNARIEACVVRTQPPHPAAELLQQQAAELATLRQQQAAPVPVSERPWENEPRWLDPDGECWWCPPDGPAYWSMVNPAMVYGGWLLPANAIPAPLEDRHHG